MFAIFPLISYTDPAGALSLSLGEGEHYTADNTLTHSHPGTNIHRITEGVTTDHFCVINSF